MHQFPSTSEFEFICFSLTLIYSCHFLMHSVDIICVMSSQAGVDVLFIPCIQWSASNPIDLLRCVYNCIVCVQLSDNIFDGISIFLEKQQFFPFQANHFMWQICVLWHFNFHHLLELSFTVLFTSDVYLIYTVRRGESAFTF